MRVDLVHKETGNHRHTSASPMYFEKKTVFIVRGRGDLGMYQPQKLDGFTPWQQGNDFFGFTCFICESV